MRSREILLWRDDDGPPRVNVFLVYASRERRDGGRRKRDPSGRISGRLVFAAACRCPLPLFSRSSSGHPVDCPTGGEIRRPPARCIPMQIILAPGTRRNRRNFMLLRNSTCLSHILCLYRVRSFSLFSGLPEGPSHLIQPRDSITHPQVYPGRLNISSMITKE